MFSFDHWAEWLKGRGEQLGREGVAVTFHDTRATLECQSNPGFALDLEYPGRVGSISFWKAGVCDYEIINTSTNKFEADEAMLEANDETVAALFARFMAHFHCGTS